MGVIFVFTIGLFAASIFKKFVKDDAGDSLLAGIIFIPTLLFWVHGKPISEFSAFGLTTKFITEARKSIGEIVKGLKDLADIPPLAPTNMAQSAYMEACEKYYILRPAMIPASGDDQDAFIVYSTYAIRSSLACGALIGVIVLDHRNRYLGSYHASFFSESLAIWAVPNDENHQLTKPALATRIRSQTIFGFALQKPVERIKPGEGFTASIHENATVYQALRVMDETEAKFIVLTSASSEFRGVVTYEAIIKGLMSAIMEAG